MSYALAFHRRVQGELDEAYRWYEEEREGLGDEFLEAVERVFDRLRAVPQAHQQVYRDVRRAVVRRFPYCVYYRVQDDRVQVIAVHHSKKSPTRWQSRADDN